MNSYFSPLFFQIKKDEEYDIYLAYNMKLSSSKIITRQQFESALLTFNNTDKTLEYIFIDALDMKVNYNCLKYLSPSIEYNELSQLINRYCLRRNNTRHIESRSGGHTFEYGAKNALNAVIIDEFSTNSSYLYFKLLSCLLFTNNNNDIQPSNNDIFQISNLHRNEVFINYSCIGISRTKLLLFYNLLKLYSSFQIYRDDKIWIKEATNNNVLSDRIDLTT